MPKPTRGGARASASRNRLMSKPKPNNRGGAQQWVEREVESRMDVYDCDFGWALLNVIDALSEFQYDELTDAQHARYLSAAQQIQVKSNARQP
jgi:hypothetical protein